MFPLHCLRANYDTEIAPRHGRRVDADCEHAGLADGAGRTCMAAIGLSFRSRYVNVPKRGTVAKLVLEPIFEADLAAAGFTDVVDADLSKYFDTIPHDELMQSLARRIVDPDRLRLIKQWLKAPVETTGEDGRKTDRLFKRSFCARRPKNGLAFPVISALNYLNLC